MQFITITVTDATAEQAQALQTLIVDALIERKILVVTSDDFHYGYNITMSQTMDAMSRDARVRLCAVLADTQSCG